MLRRANHRFTASASALTMAIMLGSTPATAATCTWLTAAGNWLTGGNWSCGTAPTSADDVVLSAAGSNATLTGGNGFVRNMTLAAGTQVTITGGISLFVSGNSIANDGLIVVSNNSDFRNLSSGTLSFTGSGRLRLDNSIANARLFSGRLSNDGSHVIEGAGELGLNQTIITLTSRAATAVLAPAMASVRERTPVCSTREPCAHRMVAPWPLVAAFTSKHPLASSKPWLDRRSSSPMTPVCSAGRSRPSAAVS
jgi:hypothetical protein